MTDYQMEEVKRMIQEIPKDMNLLYLCFSGSIAYGRDDEKSDIDLRGIYLPPIRDLLLQKRSRPYESENSDLVLQPLDAFFKLAAAGNPNILEWLFVKEDHILVDTMVSRLLRDNRKLFLNQKMLKSYLGFAKGSWNNLQKGLKTADINDKSAVRKIRKHASHIERLLKQLLEALISGSFSVWNPEKNDPIEIQEGRLVLKTTYVKQLDELKQKIDLASEKTELPENADWKKLNDLQLEIVTFYVKEWMDNQID